MATKTRNKLRVDPGYWHCPLCDGAIDPYTQDYVGFLVVAHTRHDEIKPREEQGLPSGDHTDGPVFHRACYQETVDQAMVQISPVTRAGIPLRVILPTRTDLWDVLDETRARLSHIVDVQALRQQGVAL